MHGQVVIFFYPCLYESTDVKFIYRHFCLNQLCFLFTTNQQFTSPHFSVYGCSAVLNMPPHLIRALLFTELLNVSVVLSLCHNIIDVLT